MKNRFEPGATVMYGGHGVCTLLEITQKDFGGDLKEYYVLRPAFSGSSVFYVPLDSEPLTAKMRSIKTAEELRAIMHAALPAEWVEEDRPRQNQFKAIVDGGGTEALVSSFKLLFDKQKQYAGEGRKLRAADDRYMKDIEKLLYEEFSMVFSLSKEEVVPFVFGEIDLSEKV